jgi:hypothetical protein
MRTLVEQPAVQAAVDGARDRWPRGHDAWEAVTWVLSRDPIIGRPLTESGKTRAFTLEGAQSIGLPTVTVVYEDQAPYIVVHEAKFQDAKAHNAGHA